MALLMYRSTTDVDVDARDYCNCSWFCCRLVSFRYKQTCTESANLSSYSPSLANNFSTNHSFVVYNLSVVNVLK